MSEYVGRTISLIDTEKRRYVGSLASASAETRSLVLHSVRHYGTEDRTTGSEKKVESDDEIYSIKTFMVTEVADLQVLEPEEFESQSATSTGSPETQSEDEFHNSRSGNLPSRHFGTNQTIDTTVDAEADAAFFYSQTQEFSQEGEESEVKANRAYNKSDSFFDTLGSSDSPQRDNLRPKPYTDRSTRSSGRRSQSDRYQNNRYPENDSWNNHYGRNRHNDRRDNFNRVQPRLPDKDGFFESKPSRRSRDREETTEHPSRKPGRFDGLNDDNQSCRGDKTSHTEFIPGNGSSQFN